MRDVRPLLRSGRAELVALLRSLPAARWATPTEAGHWTVGAVARHLLDDDLGLLSRWRDGDRSGLVPMDGPHAAFVAALDAKNERWVTAAAGLSGRVVTDLLAWSGAEVDAFLATVDLEAPRHVTWAGGAAPAWLDIARELTERWVHSRHIAEAVGAAVAPEDDPVLPEVLRTFAHAFPAQLAPAPTGTTVAVTLGADHWTLHRTPDAWSLSSSPPSSPPAAAITLDAATAWRHLTGLQVPPAAVRVDGDPALVASLVAVRSIIV